jgi:ATP-dependent helicase/nuclease subunit A
VETAVAGLGGERLDSPSWGSALRFGALEQAVRKPAQPAEKERLLPEWLRRPAPAEERPPRPLAPSLPSEDDAADPPPSPELREAARRGRLLHALFERLPGVIPDQRRARAERWLEKSAGVTDPELRQGLAEDACRIIEEPAFADLFGPDALAEAPVAAIIPGGAVVSGIVDRLLVGEDRILIADFKTGRRAPADLAEHPGRASAPDGRLSRRPPNHLSRSPGRGGPALHGRCPLLHALPGDLLDAHLG